MKRTPLSLLLAAFPFLAPGADTGSLRITLTDERVSLHGLAWFHEDRPAMSRLPTRLKTTFPSKVWSLAQCPAGVRIRFATDSDVVGIVAAGTTTTPPAHVTGMANGGVDFYVDGLYRGSAAPDEKGRLEKEWSAGKTRERREITIYFPVSRPVAIEEILLQSGASVWPARGFDVSKPVVFYGSSITQGSAAANPGGTYLALLGRWLDFDFVNLGFSGNGMGEPALARAVAELDASCFVVDFWANPTAEVYRKNLPKFIEILREKHPEAPIIVTGPYYNPSEDSPGTAGERQIQKRAFAREFVEERVAAGDLFITHVDGLKMISREQADGLADGRHANSLGFYFCARGLEPYLREALKLPPREPGPRP